MSASRIIAQTQVHMTQTDLMTATAALLAGDNESALEAIEHAINALTSAQRHVRSW